MRLIISILSIFILCFIACDESAEGCLDRLSENYEFEAVTACDSCCEYPEFKIDFDLYYDTLSYSPGDTLLFNSDDSVIVEQFQLVLSDFLFSGLKDDYHVIDSFVRKGVTVREDHVFLERSAIPDIAQTRIEDTISRVRFLVGLNQDQVFALKPFEEIDQSIVLDEVLDSLYAEDLDILHYGKIEFKDVLRDSLISILLPNSFSEYFEFDTMIEAKAGTDWTFKLKMDLKLLFQDLNLYGTKEEIQDVLIQNLSSSLSSE